MKRLLISAIFILAIVCPAFAVNFTVTVTVLGGTPTTVVNDSFGIIINCSSVGGTCTGMVPGGTVETFTTTGANFNSFAGDCSGLTCSMTVSTNLNITVYFGCGAGTYPCTPTGYAGTDIVIPSLAPPNFGTYTNNGAIAYDTSYLSHGQTFQHLSRIARCTDVNTIPSGGLAGYAAGFGGAGSKILWNTNSTLIHVLTNSGGAAMLPFNPTTMACSAAITKDHDLTQPGSSSTLGLFGNGDFSQGDPTVWWADGVVGTEVTSNTVITKITIDPVTLDYSFASAPSADIQYGLPIGANVAEWQSLHAYTSGTYVKHTLTGSDYKTWAATTAFNQGDIIYPGAPNCGWMVKTAGTTSGTQPTWTLVGGVCGPNPTTITDGTVIWRSLVSSPPAFIFQLISAGGTSGSSTPAFVPGGLGGHPDLASLITDASLTWENVGVNVLVPNGLWTSGSEVSPNGTIFHESFSTNTYGADPSSDVNTYAGVNYFNSSADQGTADTAVTYDTGTNIYHLFNTITLMQTDWTCTGGTGYNCSGGTFVQTLKGTATGAPCPFVLHDSSASADVTYTILSVSANFIGGGCPSPTAPIWRALQTPFNAATQVQTEFAQVTHTAFGFSHVVGVAQNNTTYGFQSGSYTNLVDLSNPSVLPAQTWQAFPCDTLAPAVWFRGDPTQPCQVVFDGHYSWAFNPTHSDTTSACGTTYEINAATANSANPGAAYQGEAICFSTQPFTFALGTAQLGIQKRFSHTWDYQTSNNFNILFQIGQLSQDGKFYAYGTDWLGQFGSTTGSAPVLPISNPNVLCLGGFPWLQSKAYTAGTVIAPISSLNGGANSFDTFQAISSGTSGTVAPNWGSVAVGGTINDNGITWKNTDLYNCRGEVIVTEMSAPSQVYVSISVVP